MAQPIVTLFGHPGVHDGGGSEIRFRTRKHLALFVYLVLDGRARGVDRDHLADLLWPKVDAQRGRHSLAQALSAIRERFGSRALTRGRGPIRLLCPVTTDLDTPLGSAPPSGGIQSPLEGLDLAAGPAFAHWVDAARARLRSRARDSLESAMAAAADRGQIDRVREHAARLYGVDPLNSTAANALADQLLEDGDHTGAIRLLQRHLARCQREVGVSPEPVEQRIRRIHAGLNGPRESASPAFPEIPEFFVGRTREIAALERHWATAQGGAPISVAIYGNPGIGKSTLLNRFCRSVRDRAWPAFMISCPEIGEQIPFAATSELIHALMRDPGVSGAEPMWLAEASRVTPGLRSQYPGIPEAPNVPAEAVRLRVAEALAQMIQAVAESGPVLIAIDDLHQMDPTSRDVLHLLLRRRDTAPTMLLSSARSAEPRGLSMGDEDPLARIQWAERISLPPLSDAETCDLISRLAETGRLDTDVRDEIVRLAEGNPYLAEMLLSDWNRDREHSLVAAEMRGDATSARWHPPDTMRRAFTRQFRGLSPQAEHVVHLLAVVGRGLDEESIRSILRMDTAAVEQATLELVSRGLVRFSNGLFSFKNEMHRRYVYSTMPHEMAPYLHHQVGRVFASGRFPDFKLQLEASHHYHRAGSHDRAVEIAVQGARVAIVRGAPREAERALASVVESCATRDHPIAIVELAAAKAAQGDFRSALDELDSVQVQILPKQEQAKARLLRADILHHSRLADDEVIAHSVTAAASEIHAIGTNEQKLQSIQLWAEVAADRGDYDALRIARDMAARIGALDEGGHTRALASLTDAYCLLMMGEPSRATMGFRSILSEFANLSLELELRRAWNGLGVALTATADFHEASRAFKEAAKIAKRIGDVEAQCNAWSNLGALSEDYGQINDSIAAYENALALMKKGISPRRSAEVCINCAGLALAVGDRSSAESCIRFAREHANLSQLWRLSVDVFLLEADYYLCQNESELAWSCFEDAEDIRNGRSYPLGNTGRYERLKRHHIWHTFGAPQAIDYVKENPLQQRCWQIADQLEVKLFEGWLFNSDEAKARAEKALNNVVQLRLFGVVLGLVQLNVWPTFFEGRRRGETSAQLVARRFPNAPTLTVPSSPVFARLDA